jgi:predicted aconitase/predicted aconitase with swiveling domain
MSHCNGRLLVHGNEDHEVCPVLASDVSLSFWGGIDEKSGVVIDTTHPLHGQSVEGKILCLPSGRGSCTASQVLLELILNGKAPKALVLRDRDGLVSVGALVAQSVFPEAKVLDIIQVDNFRGLLETDPKYGQVMADGSIVFGDHIAEVEKRVHEISSTMGEREVPELSLTQEEQSMMDGAATSAEKRAVECIIRYARIASDKPHYVDVEKAHIDGCTYIGPGGLKFVQRLVEDGGSVRIPTTLNSVSTDLRHWETLGIIPTESQQASIKLAEAYVALGCSEKSFTCAPYLLDQPPTLDQQIVWGESNAVVYANSVLGARTEKYADYLDICCAIVGKVPAVGVHLDELRQPKVVLDAAGIDFSTEDADAFSLLFPVLGHLCGSLSDGDVPILVGLESYAESITKDHLKAFCAAFGTTGTSPLIHIAGITPEAIQPDEMLSKCTRWEVVSAQRLEKTFRILDQQSEENQESAQVDWIALGNPHMSLSECEDLQNLIDALPEPKKKHDGVEVIACMARALYDQSPAIPALQSFGVKFVQDTCWCMLLEPPMIPADPSARILTNSGKYAHYGPGLTGRRFRLGSLAECVGAAVSGKLEQRQTTNFPWKAHQRRLFSTRQSCTDSASARFSCSPLVQVRNIAAGSGYSVKSRKFHTGIIKKAMKVCLV